MVIVQVFVGVLMGFPAGMFLCARYLRQEIAANIGPRLRRIEMQLDSLHAEMNLATETRLAALTKRVEDSKPDD